MFSIIKVIFSKPTKDTKILLFLEEHYIFKIDIIMYCLLSNSTDFKHFNKKNMDI